MLSTFIKLPYFIKKFVLSIFEWPFYTGFTVCNKHQKAPKSHVLAHIHRAMMCAVLNGTSCQTITRENKTKFCSGPVSPVHFFNV